MRPSTNIVTSSMRVLNFALSYTAQTVFCKADVFFCLWATTLPIASTRLLTSFLVSCCGSNSSPPPDLARYFICTFSACSNRVFILSNIFKASLPSSGVPISFFSFRTASAQRESRSLIILSFVRAVS
ncbi:hypothetical protein ABW19_dt0206506 [Dactylella cylindrospora]|nr:hypothetical protein ABW19_dt0206506 [Dactylella cylindrospora]